MSEKDVKKNKVPQNRDKEFLADPWARTRTRNGLAADERVPISLLKINTT